MKDPNLPLSELTTNRKALLINLDKSVYGTFAEIGAGQEVAGHFFKAGGAAGTIAKSMSAYDMKFSDTIYGKAGRYVSRERLLQMLEHEYNLLLERLSEARGAETTFFVFANTVAAASYSYHRAGNGWMGVRFQTTPGGPHNDILVHGRMLDSTPLAQQEALGIFGVNFIWASLVYNTDVDRFIASLLDQIEANRLEVDMLEFIGPAFKDVENRVVSLKLVEKGLTNAVMFGPDGETLLPSEALYKKSVLVERGSFRPVTHVNTDIITLASEQFRAEEKVDEGNLLTLFEITVKNLLGDGNAIDYKDFLARVDTISALGHRTLVSNYMEYYRLSSYFRRYTEEMIGIALGINHLQAVFDEEYYHNLDGGILESFGRMFKANVKLYVYPMKGSGEMRKYLDEEVPSTFTLTGAEAPLGEDEFLLTADNIKVSGNLRHLYLYLLQNRLLEPIRKVNVANLDTSAHHIFDQIRAGESGWESKVPAVVARIIKDRKLWQAQ